MAELFDVDAERTVLGACILEQSAMASAASVLEPEDFYSGANRMVFAALCSLFEGNRPIDLVTLKATLGVDLDKVGGVAYLASLIDGLPRVSSVEQWANIIKDRATVRRLKSAAVAINELSEEKEDTATLVDAALAEVLKVAERAQSGEGFRKPSVTAKSAMARLEVLSMGGSTGLLTGISDFDDITNGLRAPQLVVIAARPGMGKSAAATTIADNVAETGKVVGIVSLEMDHDEVGIRRLAKRAEVNPQELRLNEKLWARVNKAYSSVSKNPVFVDDDPYLTLTQIKARSRRLQAEHGLDLLIVDYLQLLHSESKNRFDRQQEIAAVARGLKNLAKDLHVPVIALSQLSRKVEDREKKTPVLSDLRESGEIEQAADIVVMLHRPWVYDSTRDPRGAEWIVVKHRNGQLGTIHVEYIPEWTMFRNLQRKESAA